MKYKGISKNSKEIKKDYIYCCFEGQKVSGYNYIDEALANGATKIIGEKNLEISNYEQVENITEAMIKYAQEIYENPQKELKLIGVTGTDGKTSTALIIDSILNKLSKSSYLGTNGFFVNNQELEYTGFTTPFADKLYQNFKESVKAESEYFVMEVSSHALEQKRVNYLNYECAIFTNLSEEHLDFHHTMENYYQAKKKLFEMLTDNGSAIINIDDKYGMKLKNSLQNKNIITISKDANLSPTYLIKNIELGITGTNFELVIADKTYLIKSPLLAEFNIYNLVSAIACIHTFGFAIEDIINKIANIRIPGRLEIINVKNKPNVIIDFAHTAIAIEKVMKFINKLPKKGKIYVVTGSAGERDSLKRPAMGKAASDYADYFIITEDDPRSESVAKIAEELEKGIENQNCEIKFIENRKKAIEYVINKANPEDTILLFGKGEMQVMYYDGYTEEYSERAEVLKNMNQENEEICHT